MKLLKLHITILVLLGLPGLLVPLSLWAPANFIPDILGIFTILYVMLWIFHTMITSLLMGGLLFFRIDRTRQAAVISTHVIVFIAMLAYAVFLFSS